MKLRQLLPIIAMVGAFASTVASAVAQTPGILALGEDRVWKFDAVTGVKLGIFGTGKIRQPKSLAQGKDGEFLVGDIGGIKKFDKTNGAFLGNLYTSDSDNEVIAMTVAPGGAVFAMEVCGSYSGQWLYRLFRINYSTGLVDLTSGWSPYYHRNRIDDPVEMQLRDTTIYLQMTDRLVTCTAFDLNKRTTVWIDNQWWYTQGVVSTSGAFLGLHKFNGGAYFVYGFNALSLPNTTYETPYNTMIMPGFDADAYSLHQNNLGWYVTRHAFPGQDKAVVYSKRLQMPASTKLWRATAVKL